MALDRTGLETPAAVKHPGRIRRQQVIFP